MKWLMARLATRWLTKRLLLRQKRSLFCWVLAVAPGWLMFALPAHCRAAASGAALGVSATVGPWLAVDGQGAAGSELVMGSALPGDGIPFQITVRSNAPWRWSARVESAAGLPTLLRCVYAYRAIQAFGGAPGGPGQADFGVTDRGIPGPPLPRGEMVLEGRILAPPGTTLPAPGNVTLVWTVTQVDVNVGQPLTRTMTTRLHGGGASTAVVPPAR
jgi:hypothetical protein